MANDLSTVQQMSETRDYLYKKTKVHVEFIGEDSAIATLASAQKKGTHFSGLSGSGLSSTYIDSSRTEKIQADRTKWIVDYSIYTPQGGGGGGGSDPTGPYFTTSDSMTMVQYQFPLYKYLSADEAAAVASWENLSEEEVEYKKTFQYSDNGSYKYLSSVSEKAEKVAKKLFAGIEYVQKSYPQITHVEKFANRMTMTQRQNRLNHIDTTSDVPDLIDGYSWLKTQYDWQENDDSTWTLTESWIGVPESDPWDEDLYGQNAWDFYRSDDPTPSPDPDPDPEP